MTISAGIVHRQRHSRHISTAQKRWPTLGWALGELRWYAIGGALGVAAFVGWIGVTAARALLSV